MKEEIRNSDVVVSGKILSKERVILIDSTIVSFQQKDSTDFLNVDPKMVVVRYELLLESKYKGKFKSDTLEIFTGIGGGDCGVRFEIGMKYIVYGSIETYFGTANNDYSFPVGPNIYWTNICTRTQLLNQEEIKKIEKFKRNRLKK